MLSQCLQPCHITPVHLLARQPEYILAPETWDVVLVDHTSRTCNHVPSLARAIITARRLRDEVLPPLGVQLTDRAGTDQGSDWVLECPAVLRQEAAAKEREAALQRSQKT